MTQSFLAGPRAGRIALAAGALVVCLSAQAAGEAQAVATTGATAVVASPAAASPIPTAVSTQSPATEPAAVSSAAAPSAPAAAVAPAAPANSTFAGPRAPQPAATSNSSAAGAAVASASSLTQVALVLGLVVALIAGAAWLLRRLGVARNTTGSTVRIVSGVSLSNRERILVVEVADQWIVVGVSPGGINTLTTMPRQEPVPGPDGSLPAPPGKQFAHWLKQTIERRNAAARSNAGNAGNDHNNANNGN